MQLPCSVLTCIIWIEWNPLVHSLQSGVGKKLFFVFWAITCRCPLFTAVLDMSSSVDAVNVMIDVHPLVTFDLVALLMLRLFLPAGDLTRLCQEFCMLPLA